MGYQKEKASNGGVWKLEGRVGVDRNPLVGESNVYQNRLESGRSIFITWTKPLFDGGYRSAVKDELAYRQESAELQTTQATNQAREDVRLALDNYRLAMNTIRVQRNIIHTSQQIIDSIKLGSTAGNSNYDRLLQETSKLYENKYELSQANVRALESYIALKIATSSLDTSDLAAISLGLKPHNGTGVVAD
ncbi:MAG: TolC family protein, partial [Bdellovibrio sp.]|nr:TolC family protein [Bdellovibrio sp.]